LAISGRDFLGWMGLLFWQEEGDGDGFANTLIRRNLGRAAKLQLEVVVFPAGSQSRFSPILFMKNEDNTSGTGKVENSGASWAKNFH